MAHRINSPSAVAAFVPSGQVGAQGHWQSGNKATGAVATNGNSDFYEMVQEELQSVLAAAGIAPVFNTFTQLRDSILSLIQRNAGAYGGDTGAVNAYVVAFAPAIAAPGPAGMVLTFLTANPNTQASTLNGITVIRNDGTRLRAGDIVAGFNTVRSDGANYRLLASGKTRLLANMTIAGGNPFYLNEATGNDTNDGLTPGTAWATMNGAFAAIQLQYDLNGKTVQISMANGNYATLAAAGTIAGQFGPLQLQYVAANPGQGNVTIAAVNATAIAAGNMAQVFVSGLTLSATGNGAGQGIGIAGGGVNGDAGVVVFDNIWFGACAVAHFSGLGASGQAVWLAGGVGYTVVGDAQYHAFGNGPGGIAQIGAAPVTFSGVRTFTVFAYATLGGLVGANAGAVFTNGGAVVGQKYLTPDGGFVNTGTGNVNFLPGNAAGNSAGGYYT